MTRSIPPIRVLLIEDDVSIKLALYKALTKELYEVVSAKTGSSGIRKATERQFDIILLDLGLPDISGYTVCRELRSSGVDAPIIILTSEFNSSTKVQLLDAGANDYMTKPFRLDELMARMRAGLRVMPRRPPGAILTAGDLLLSIDDRMVERNGVAIRLRKKECEILTYLMRHAGTNVSRSDITQHVWDVEGWTNAVDVHIKHLRDKIDRPFEKPVIVTVHGIGYRLDVPRRGLA